tara:strand:+ start:5219 stop:5863 length:645 start_codon:yes stop_codon:yes gene_type:complete
MKKLICFSLWGDNPTYTVGAIKNADLAKKHYPGWICRYYIADCVPKDIVDEILSRDNTEIMYMGKGDWTAMFWRFYPASHSDCEIMLSRDTDSRLNSREAAAVNEWIDSGKAFHIMRDHPQHRTEILGGMWGVRGDLLINLESMIDDYIKGDFWQVDQNFLREKVYPLIRNNCCIHDEFFERAPFPTERKKGLFIGQAFDEHDNVLYPEHSKLV